MSFRPLVTSFTGKYGSIQYCVRAVLERPPAPAQSVKRELQVVSHIDVNTPALLVRSPPSPVPLPLCLQPSPLCLASLVAACPVTFWCNLITLMHSLQICDSKSGKLQIVCGNTLDCVAVIQGRFCQKVTWARNALIRLNNNNAHTQSSYFSQSSHSHRAVVF